VSAHGRISDQQSRRSLCARELSRFRKCASRETQLRDCDLAPGNVEGKTLSADGDNVGGGRLRVRSKATSRTVPPLLTWRIEGGDRALLVATYGEEESPRPQSYAELSRIDITLHCNRSQGYRFFICKPVEKERERERGELVSCTTRSKATGVYF